MASAKYGTGVTEAADLARVRTSFTVVIAYSVFVGTAFFELSGEF